jgi:hypothetical protein
VCTNPNAFLANTPGVNIQLPLYRMAFLLCHGVRVTLNSYFPNLGDARGPVGSKYKPKNFSHNVIEFFTIVWI